MTAVDSRPLRIAYGRIAQETNAFSPVTTELEDFERLHLIEGVELHEACGRGREEVRGLIDDAELSGFRRAVDGRGVHSVPLLSAWAMPSGPLSERAFDELKARLLDRLRAAGPVDGVYLALHGALRARGRRPEAEEDLVESVRAVVGPDVPVAVSVDLHANLTAALMEPVTLLGAYRTNPHRDLARLGRRMGSLLLRAVRREIRPVVRWRSLPMILGGGMTIDFLAPMRAIFRRMSAMERDPRVLCASLCMCHLWNDSPDLGWSVVVVTDGDEVLADALADELAELAWGVRNVPPPRFLAPLEAIAKARRAILARRLGTVCLTDVSDIVGAGAPGESTHLLSALLQEGRGMVSYVPVRDLTAVEALWGTAPGTSVTARVGGRLDPSRSPAVEVRGRVLACRETTYWGRVVVLDLDHVKLVVTELAPLTLKPSFYARLGLNPWRADVVVVKNFFHYRWYFLAVHRRSIPVKTRGCTDFDIALALPFNDPVHPKDVVADWRDGDRRRRGGAAMI